MDDKEKTLENYEEEKIQTNLEEDQEKLKEENNLIPEIDKKQKIIIGTFEQAPKFLQQNEYIKNGYVINCNSFKNSLRCLFKFHNETMNTWTHLLGSLFFIFLFFYTIFFITN